MRKLCVWFFILMCTAAMNGSAQVVESFEDVPIGEMPPAGWLKWEEAGGRGWSNSWAGRQPMPGWMSGTNSCPPGGGNRMAYVTYTHGGSKTNDLWLISPTLKGITATSTVSFWQNNAFTNFADSLFLWISTNPAAYRKSQFSIKAWGLDMPRGAIPGYVPPATGDFGAWTKVTVNIGTQITAGTDIRLGFQEYWYNNWYDVRAIELDLIESDLWAVPILTTTAVRAYGDVIELDYTIFPGYPAGEMGICWGQGPHPEAMTLSSMEWNKGYHVITNRGSGTAVLSNMNAGTKWWLRPYVKHAKAGNCYGNEVVVYPGAAGGEGALFESFETTPVGQMPPLGWSKWQEAGGRGWSNSYAGRQPMPGWMSGTNSTPPGGGDRTAYVTYTHGGSKTNDLWLISPTIENVPPNCQLSFWQNNCFTNFADNLYVYISQDTDADRKSYFTNQMWHLAMPRGQVPGYVPPGTGDFGGWSNPVINVTDYVPPGSDVRIAFREYFYNNWYDVRAIELDLIEMGTTNIRNALHFDGTDDYAVLRVTNQPTAFSIEVWVRPLSIKAQTIVTRTTDNPQTAYNEMLAMNGSGQFVFYNYDTAERTITSSTTAQTGKWYHVAGTAQENGTMRLYVNGVEQGTALSIGTLQTGLTNIYVGTEASLGTYGFFHGELDEIRIWNDVQTATELNENMCRYMRGMEDGLLACYRLDSTFGTDLFDSTQRSTYDSWFGPAEDSYGWTHGKLEYDGVDDQTIVADTNCYADYTVAAWVYPEDSSARNIMTFSDGDPVFSYNRQLRIRSDGKFEFYNYDGTARSAIGTTVLTPRQWYHVVGTAKNGSDMKLFVNGVEEAFTSAGNTLWGTGYTGIYVGARSVLGNYTWFKGRIYGVSYTNYAKDLIEIQADYNTYATGADSSTWPAWTNTATPIGSSIIAGTTNSRAVWSSNTTNIPANRGLNLKLDDGNDITFAVFGDNNLSGTTTLNMPSGSNASRMQRVWALDVQGASSLPLDFTFTPSEAGAPEMGSASLDGLTNRYQLIWRTSETGTFTTKVAFADSASSGIIIFSNCSASSGYYTLSLEPPPAPEPLAATNITAHSLYANWNTATAATNYYIDVAGDSGYTAWVDGYNNRLLGDVLTCLVTGLTEGTPYYYRLRAEHGGAVSTNSGTINPTTLTEGSIGAQTVNVTTPYTTNAQQMVTITNSGETTFSFTSAITYGAGPTNWLTLTPTSGTVAANSSISQTSDVDVTAINVGTYYATNIITSATATNSPYEQVIQLTIVKSDQGINFPVISTQLTTNTVNVSVSATSGLGVSLAVGSGPASISGGTNVTFTTSGTVELVATQPGNSNFNAASPVTNTFTVNKSPQSAITFSPATPQTYNTTNALSASGGSGGGAFSFAVVSGPGTIVDTTNLRADSGINSIAVRATKASDAMYLAHSTTSTVACAKAAQTITFPAIADQLTTNTVNLAATSDSGLAVSFAVGSGPASIASGTNLTATASGNVEIIATQAGDDNYDPAPAITNTIVFNKAPQSLPLSFLPTTPQVYNTTNTMAASGGSGTGVFTYAISSGPGTIVDSTNLTVTSGINSVDVIAIKGSDDMYLSQAITSSVNCAKAEQTITFPAISDQLTTNTVPLAATASSELGITFAVASGSASIASGSNLTFTADGSVSITANQTGNDNYNPAPETTNTFNVNKSPQLAITFNPTTPQTYNTTNALSASGGSGGGAFSYAVVSGPGTIVASTNIQATSGINTIAIRATKASDAMYLEHSTTSSVNCAKATQTITFPAIAAQLTTNIVNLAATANSGLAVSFAVGSGPASIVSGTNVTFTTAGTVEIIASQAGDNNYNATSTTNSFAVNKSPQGAITFTPTTPQVYNTTNALSASGGSGSGAFSYAISTGPGTIVGSTNLTVTSGINSVDIIATKASDAMYLAHSITSSVNCAKAEQTITFPIIATQLTTNTVNLAATASSELGITFAVASGSASIASGSNLSFTASGSVSITANQAGNDNYNPAPETTNAFNVNKTPQAALIFSPASPQVYHTTNTLSTFSGSGTGAVTYAVASGAGQIVNTTDLTITAGTGTVEVIATKATDDMFLATATTSIVNCAKAEQTITFPGIATQLTTNTVNLAATASSELSVSFAIASGPASIASGTNVTFSASGSVDIIASQTGDDNYNPAPSVTNTFNVNKSPQGESIVFTPATPQVYHTTNILTASGGSGTGIFSYAIFSGAGQIVDTTNLTITAGTGTVEVIATKASDDMYLVHSTTSSVACAKAEQTITFPVIADQLTTNTPTVTATASSGLAVSLAVSSGPASLSSPLSPSSLSFSTSGSVSIVATQLGDNNYNPAPSATNTFNVNKTPQAPLIFTPITPQVYHTTNTLSTTGGSGTGIVTYVAASGAGQIVDATNLTITAGTGLVTIVATKATDDMFLPTAATSTVTAVKELQTISFASLPDTFWTNTVYLSATASSELPVSFSVATGPASISGNTNLTFTGIGEVRIQASQAGDDNFEAAPSVTNTFNTLGPQFTILGTNAIAITNNAAAAPASGTAFNNVLIGFGSLTNTFTMTNSGTAVMSLLAITTNGANASSFEISNVASQIPANTSTTFDIIFNPAYGMVNNASFVFDFDGTNTPYTLNVAGYGEGGGITLATNALSFTASYVGADPSDQTLILTNTGVSPFTFTNTLVYGTNATGWLTITPSDTTVALNGATTFTNTINATNLNVGTYYATNTITALDATNSPQTFVIELEIIKADQTITFPTIADQLTTNTPPVTATALSGLPVSLAVASGPASLSGPLSPSSLSFSTSGTVAIVATQPGSHNWNPAPAATNIFNVTKTPQAALIFTPASAQTYHTTNALSTTGGSGTGLVTYAVASGAGQIVNTTNLTITAGTGTVTIVASKATDDIFLSTATTSTVTAVKELQTISFASLSDTFWTNTVYLSATASSELPVSFNVASGPASINGNTNLTFTGIGEVRIQASQAGDDNFEPALSITNSFNTLGPQFALLGTNAVEITNNASASTVSGADFGNVLIGFNALTNTFTITNSGSAVMTIMDLATNGANAAAFEISNLTSQIPANTSTTFDIIFNPAFGMVNNASFVFDFDGTNTPYTLNVAGYGQGGGITLATNALSFTTSYVGADPSNQTLILTNTGVSPFTFTNTLTYGTNATGWLTITPSGTTVALNGATTFTNTINATNLNVGTYYATNIITSFDATNSPQTFVIELEIIKADQTITFPTIADQLTTNTPSVTATALSGLPVSLAVASGPASLSSPLSPSSLSFSTSGQVAIVATQLGNANWNPAPPATNTFNVTKAAASLTFSNLNQVYSGTPRTVSVASVPSVSSVILTYNASTTPPTNAGSYTVIATIDDLLYHGGRTDTLTVAKSPQSISFPGIPAQKTTNTVFLTATAVDSGLPIDFSIVSGPATLSGGTNVTFSTEGTVFIQAAQTGDLNWVATSVTNSFTVSKSVQSELTFNPASPQTYLTTNAVSATGGSGTGTVTYAVVSGPGEIQNLSQLYINSGSGMVQVAATKAADAMYDAQTVTAVVSCTRADQTITFPVISDQLITNSVVLNAVARSQLPITYSIRSGPGVLNASNLTFSATGLVTVTAAQPGNTNWNPTAVLTNTLQVYPILARITTVPIVAVDVSTIECGGEVTYNGGAPIIQRGLCWSTNHTPSTSDFLTRDGTGEGSYGSMARGLDPSTVYYLCAYAINEVGTSYGTVITATTSNLPPPPPPVTYTWNGSGSDQWNDATNWGGYVVPTHTNTAFFYETGASNLRINLHGPRSVQSLAVLSNATRTVTLYNGMLLLTNSAATLQSATGKLVLADTLLAGNFLITNNGSILLAGGFHADTLDKHGIGILSTYTSNTVGNNATIHQGILQADGDLAFSASNQLIVGSAATLAPRATNTDGAAQFVITNQSAGSSAVILDGILSIGIHDDSIDAIDLADNALILGSNSILDITISGGDLNITNTYTLATAATITGQFAQINGLTAHTLNISSNRITLDPSFVWDGTQSTNWSEALSWTNSPGSTPGPDNDAGFAATATNEVVVNVDTNPSVRSIRASGAGTILIEGSGHSIILTNNDVRLGNTPAVSAQDGAEFVLQCNLQTLPGARITSMQTTNPTTIRIRGCITPSSGIGNLILDGNGRIELACTNTFGSTTNALEIRGAQVFIGEDSNLGVSDASLLFTNSGILHVTNTTVLGRTMQLQGDGGVSVPSANHTVTITNTISGTGRLQLLGNGTIILTADSTTDGADIQCGALHLNGRLSGTDDINMQNPAVLRGNGIIALQSSLYTLNILSGARCAPGNSIGTITVYGSMTVDGTLDIELENSTSDLINVRDTLTLNSNAVLNLSGTPDGTTTYTLLRHASRGGYFYSANLPQHYTLTYSTTKISLTPGSGAEIGHTNIVREGSGVSIPLSIADNTQWTAVSTSSWVTITSGASGRGPGAIELSIAKNEGIARRTTLWIAGMTYTIMQQADRAAPLDYDGDNKADIAVYWPADGFWYILQSHNLTARTELWGWDQAFCAPGDYDGDAIIDVSVYYPDDGTWSIIYSSDNSTHTFNWGWRNTEAVPADYDGDGVTDIAVYAPDSGSWYIWESKQKTSRIYSWGWSSAQPVPADYDGDGMADPAVYAADNGMWYIWLTQTQTAQIQSWGWSDALAVPADYDGDSRTDIATYYPDNGAWSILLSGTTNILQRNWGWSEVLPVPADYDGDGIADLTVYCAENGLWYIWQSATQTRRIQSWGWSEAEPTN